MAERNLQALLIVDMQIGNFAGSNAIPNSDALLATCAGLVRRARDAGITLCYIKNNGGLNAPDEPGTPGWAVHPEMDLRSGDFVIHKDTPDSFHETKLDQILRARLVRRLVIAGLQTEYCIDTTVRRAASLGYEVTLPADGHNTWPSEHLTAAQIVAHHNRVLGDWFAHVIPAKEVAFG